MVKAHENCALFGVQFSRVLAVFCAVMEVPWILELKQMNIALVLEYRH